MRGSAINDNIINSINEVVEPPKNNHTDSLINETILLKPNHTYSNLNKTINYTNTTNIVDEVVNSLNLKHLTNIGNSMNEVGNPLKSKYINNKTNNSTNNYINKCSCGSDNESDKYKNNESSESSESNESSYGSDCDDCILESDNDYPSECDEYCENKKER